MHKRLSDNIVNGALAMDDDAKVNDQNPMITGDWDAYLNGARNEIFDEIEHGNRLDEDAAEIKERSRVLMSQSNEMFKDAVQIDEIEDFDNDQDGNHNVQTQGGDEDSEDDDIIIDRTQNVSVGSIKCPLTQQIFVQPVKSKLCGHTFEKEAVENYIRRQAEKNEIAECPLPGCTNLLTSDQMIRDVKMQKRIKAQSKQQQNEGSDDENDAVMDLTVPV